MRVFVRHGAHYSPSSRCRRYQREVSHHEADRARPWVHIRRDQDTERPAIVVEPRCDTVSRRARRESRLRAAIPCGRAAVTDRETGCGRDRRRDAIFHAQNNRVCWQAILARRRRRP